MAVDDGSGRRLRTAVQTTPEDETPAAQEVSEGEAEVEMEVEMEVELTPEGVEE